MPDELVIAFMQEDPPDVRQDLPFAVHLVRVAGDPMPLARARNRAAAAASGDVLAFLDVDCIPDRHFVRRAGEAMRVNDNGIFLPEVRYLPACDQNWLEADGRSPDFALLERKGVRHPAKPGLAGCDVAPVDTWGELWGLAFILHARAWKAAGGMDERYEGYGAEETDFARRLEASGAGLFWLGGTICYHQHHPVHKPPLQHFDSIIRNARLYRERWGKWCMDYWLDDFARRGLVERRDDSLLVLRRPTQTEIAESRQDPDVLFS